MKRSPPDRKAQAQRAALNALRRAKRAAERAGVKLSDWEGEFLGSVSERVAKFGRAFPVGPRRRREIRRATGLGRR